MESMRTGNSDSTSADQWWRRAVFYELPLRHFADGNADGIGDFVGAIARLDYLKDLGISAIWLLPFNQSPLLDGGYDVSDYHEVHPDFGTLDDARAFVTAAHQRDMHVIMDLVINHTSDQHPWFLEARSSVSNPKRDWYMWSTSGQEYASATLCFPSLSPTNWEWDSVSQTYYFHRFFPFQPDLNFDNPEVHDAVLDVMRFWIGIGFDGFRLDAIAHLYAREGTSCNHLPESHTFLAKMRHVLDQEYGGQHLLLAEADGAAEDVALYFGKPPAPECHMCFDFPLTTRLFAALAEQRRDHLVEAMASRSTIVDGAQYAVFLRNHDHVFLDNEPAEIASLIRQYFAPDRAQHLNDGVRRRLAPMLDNNPARIALAFALLLSLPGTPILYYGDEIGMGDNVALPDRDGLRTPMQWSSAANAGFSEAPQDRLYLPVIDEGEATYRKVNVEVQQAEQDSLLDRIRRLLRIREAHRCLAVGDFCLLETGDDRVFAFLRIDGSDVLLCVANLSFRPISTEVDLGDYESGRATDLINNVGINNVERSFGDTLVTELLPSGFSWMKLE